MRRKLLIGAEMAQIAGAPVPGRLRRRAVRY